MAEQQIKFNLSQAKNGMSIVSAQIDTRPGMFLHSTVNPVKEAKKWLDRVELTPFTAYFVLGFGLGYHVQVLLERLPEGSHIYVIEYSKEVNLFEVASKLFANDPWMHDPRIIYFATGEFRELAVSLALDMYKRCINKVTLCRYYPAMAIFPEFFRRLEQELVPSVGETFCLNFNNNITQGIQKIQNAWVNVPYICYSPGVKVFANRFAGKPAIIVAAGPSLNKNISVLKKCTDRAVVIAAGSTMGALYIQGITPCFLAVSETASVMYDNLAGNVDPGTILLALYDVQNKVVSEYPGKRLFAVDQTTTTLDSVKHLLPDTDELRQNISVATVALNFALYCGANPIIFVGQDLSFTNVDPDTAQHAIGVKALEYSKDDWQRTFVPGYDGGEVSTALQMREVIQYLEGLIKRNPNTTFINATEGGARISGTVQLKLSEVYDRYLSEEIFIDKIIDEIYSQFVPRNDTELLKVLLKIREEITQMRMVTDEFITDLTIETEGILEWSQTEYDKIQEQFVRFFEKMSQTNIYQYIEPGIAPFRELVEYRIREGMAAQNRIDAYFQLGKDLIVVLECLDNAVQESVARMGKILMEMIGQNGRKEQ